MQSSEYDPKKGIPKELLATEYTDENSKNTAKSTNLPNSTSNNSLSPDNSSSRSPTPTLEPDWSPTEFLEPSTLTEFKAEIQSLKESTTAEIENLKEKLKSTEEENANRKQKLDQVAVELEQTKISLMDTISAKNKSEFKVTNHNIATQEIQSKANVLENEHDSLLLRVVTAEQQLSNTKLEHEEFKIEFDALKDEINTAQLTLEETVLEKNKFAAKSQHLEKENNSLLEQIQQLQNDAKKVLNVKMERRKAVANPSNKKNKEDEEMAETIVLLENQLRKLEKENENLQTEVKKKQ